MTRIAAVLGVVLGSLGCRAAPPRATAADAARANVELAELQRGRQLLVTKCGSCHRTPLPSDPWRDHLDDMAKRANLDAEQRHLIEQYLFAMSPR